ncbi:DUF1707 SHOCT-like domain-containing protein [Actinoalloteichus hymeniacidonis]|uniref:DUF1707 family protein/predicted membrane protein (DUF2154) n=1 Tax=Actinoalloteichus hymeniacidonis TaxID=340345 RepID=A0AAC9HQ42_9PSEU|nr:DUF1707 domain-containing protein [Actinoalloteichus hymeniacidonis]AOS63251.1 putative DUF1707 family protein/predicted membrane protein (DUF2154) [Actinoalloteichus hymeniacidonis]MBB5908710.1 hypothetical protein [Actinoalloteichus hymeniacidonis]
MTEQPDRRPEVRVSDAERDQTATLLNQAVGEGRLTLEEFTERVGLAYAADTRGQLEKLVTDLPVAADRSADAAPAKVEKDPSAKRKWKLALLGDNKVSGRWRVHRRMGFFSVLGDNKIDLSNAELGGPEVEITLFGVLGDYEIIVPKGVRVEHSKGFRLLGDSTVKVDESAVLPNSPVVRIKSFSLLGDDVIRHPKKKRRRWTDDDDED